MNDTITETLLLDALADAGLTDRPTARRIVSATLGALSQRLTVDERMTFARCLSAPLRDAFRRTVGTAAESITAEELYRRVAELAGTRASLAREHAQVVMETIGRHAPYETLRRIASGLPDELASLLRVPERELGEPAPYVETFPAAQSHSVVREENPHSERKLSSGKPVLRRSDVPGGARHS
jgi:uncharacterized protein (DUF2267 family)